MMVTIQASAQCPVNNTTTNPDKTIWENPPYDAIFKKNSGTNFFDWRQEHFAVSVPSFPYSQVTSPYYFGATAVALGGIAQGEGNPDKYDFYPQDGWELIRKNFGLRADGSTITNEAMIGPYYVLYNKYSGTLRVIGWTATAVGFFPTVNVKVGFKDNGKTSGLFSFYNALAKPLDQRATNHATTSAALTGDPLVPFFADFKLAYDPCTCVFDSNLEIEFNKVTTMNIDLYVRLLAINKPVNQSEHLVQTGSTALYDKNYLTSVYNNDEINSIDYKKVTAGMLHYRTMDDLVRDYKLSAEATKDKEEIKKSLELMGQAIGVATSGSGLSDFLKNFITLFSDFFATEPGIPSSALTVIQGEMTLSGLITNSVDQHISIPIANPGSLNSKAAVECCTLGPNYPMYNEVLGVFALLETPEISLNTTVANGIYTTTFQLATPLKYMFNPTVKINLNNSRVYTSFEAETYGATSSKNFFEAYTSYNSNSNKSVTKYSSTPVPIESMIFAKMEYDGIGNMKTPNLSILLDLEFQDLNRLGQPNRSLMVLTYPVKIINSSSASPLIITGYENYKTIGATSYYQSQTISVWKNINITGNQTSSPVINPVTFAAAGNVVVQPGVTIGRNFILKAGVYPPNAFTSNVYPQAVNYYLVPSAINCTASSYKANLSASARSRTDGERTQTEETKIISVYPNPAISKVFINFSLAVTEKVDLNIISISGIVIANSINRYFEEGSHELEIDISNIPPGVYLIRIQSVSFNKTEKLIIVK